MTRGGCGVVLRQILAMLRKNLWLKKSKPLATLMEVLLPCFFVLLLALGYWLASNDQSQPHIYGAGSPGNPTVNLSFAFRTMFCAMPNATQGSNTSEVRTPRVPPILTKLTTIESNDRSTSSESSNDGSDSTTSWSESHGNNQKGGSGEYKLAEELHLLPCIEPYEKVICLGAPLQDICFYAFYDVPVKHKNGTSAGHETKPHDEVIPALITGYQFMDGLPLRPFDFDMYMILTKYVKQFHIKWDGFLRRDVKESLLHFGGIGFIVDPAQRGDGGIKDAFDIPIAKHCMETTTLCGRILQMDPNSIFSTMEEAQQYTTNHGAELWAVIDTRQLSPPLSNTYTIMMNYSATPWTFMTVAKFSQGLGKRDFLLYSASGFSTLQLMINQFIMVSSLSPGQATMAPPPFIDADGIPFDTEDTSYTPMPTAGYNSNQFLTQSGHFVPLVMTFGMLYSLSQIVSSVVEEKEGRQRESMLIMGLRPSCFYIAWFLTNFLLEIVASLCATLLAKLTFFGPVSYMLLWLVMFAFAMQVVCFGFLITVFFSKSRVAAITAPLLLFVTAVPYYAFKEGTPESTFVAASLIPTTAFAYAINTITSYVTAEIPVPLSALTAGDGYTILHCLGMMVLTSVLYLVLAWYLDQVLPSEFGVKKHPLFILPGFSGWWSRRQQRAILSQRNSSTEGGNENIQKVDWRVAGEPVASVNALTKKYSGAEVKAVDNLNLSVHQGEVLSLLGHNGAGKSTTIHMLTGMIYPSSGSVEAFGDLVAAPGIANFTNLRSNTGYCPQHNVLWPTLTVEEHLIFFSVLKGLTWEEAAKDAKTWATRVALGEKFKCESRTLSGGQKRKLCVAIAFIGDSKLVVLDEPTAGMDVHSRRSLWKVILEQRPHCATLLCTHFMDEADLLSSRIAIMLRGQLKCCGTSLFLKQKLGLGYKLTLVMTDRKTERAAQVVKLLTEYGANPVKQPTNSPLELRYQIDLQASTSSPSSSPTGSPNSKQPAEATSSDAANMFGALETQKEALGIRMMGLSLTNLEEVFLNIAQQVEGLVRLANGSPAPQGGGSTKMGAAGVDDADEDDEDTLADQGEREKAPLLAAGPSTTPTAKYSPERDESGQPESSRVRIIANEDAKIRGSKEAKAGMFTIQLKAQFLKRFHCAKRDRRTMCFQFVLPTFFLALALLILLLHAPNQPAVRLDGTMYHHQTQALLTDRLPASMTNSKLTQKLGYFLTPNQQTGNMTTVACNDEISHFNGSCVKPLGATLLAEVAEHPLQRSIAFAPLREFNDSSPCAAAYHNATFPHAIAEALNYMSNSQLSSAQETGDSLDTFVPIVAWNHPMPLSETEHHVVDSIRRIVSAIFILIPFTFIPANYVTFIVRERATKAQHLQWISGASTLAYWLSSFVFDLLQYMLTEALAIIIFVAFQREEFIGDPQTFGATLCLFLFYGIASIPMSYLASYCFTKHTTAQNVVMFVNFFFGFLLVLASQILSSISKTRDINRKLCWFYRLVPSYALGEGIITLTGRDLAEYLLHEKPDAFSMLHYESKFGGFLGGVGTSLTYLGCTAPVLGLALLVIEWSKLYRYKALQKMADEGKGESDDPPEDGGAPDEEVEAEAALLTDPARKSTVSSQNSIIVRHLRKTYGKIQALRGVTYGVRKGEVFALLGANGAGKTTTIGIVTGDLVQSSGKVEVCGHDTLDDLETVRRNVGYCPQFDALHDTMTPEEHLMFYLRLRGISSGELRRRADAIVEQLGLGMYKNTAAKDLSGGNRRRLSLGIAIAGDPSVVMLDEPSAGMDPLARRELWGVVEEVAKSRSVVLTTHHLEEVEALADRVGIMVHGTMRCLGTLQTLKTRYGGAAYEVHVSYNPSAATPTTTDSPSIADSLTLHLKKRFGVAISTEQSSNANNGGEERRSATALALAAASGAETVPEVSVLEHLPSAGRLVLGVGGISLSVVFRGLQSYARRNDIDFAVNQSSLEQAFLHVAGSSDDNE